MTKDDESKKEAAPQLPRISGFLKAVGLLSAQGQRAVRQNCEAGRTQHVVEAVAEYLLGQGMSQGRVPANAGVKTKDLLARVEAAIAVEVTNYHQSGGVLVAKGFVSPLGLQAEMAKQWIQGFAAPITTMVDLEKDLERDEVFDRLTLVALFARKAMVEFAKPSGNGDILIPEDKIEGLCRRLATDMFRVFKDPNAANHEHLHKEDPHGHR